VVVEKVEVRGEGKGKLEWRWGRLWAVEYGNEVESERRSKEGLI